MYKSVQMNDTLRLKTLGRMIDIKENLANAQNRYLVIHVFLSWGVNNFFFVRKVVDRPTAL